KKDINEIIKECEKNNVIVILNGLNVEDNEEVLKISKSSPNIFASIGMHPSYEYDRNFEKQAIQNKDDIVAIGEVGLDFKYSNKEEQISNFKRIILLAEKINKPLIIHSRKAQEEVLKLISNAGVSAVLHAFLATNKLIREAAELPNTYLSIPSNVVYSEQSRNIAILAPMSRLLCETDSPYMNKNERNTPLNVINAYKAITAIKKISMKEAESAISLNVKKVFKNIEIIKK
ncbi:hypothetical protein COZ55_02285, partial [archaeon CG_4_8_14_3_um_filter_38_5]